MVSKANSSVSSDSTDNTGMRISFESHEVDCSMSTASTVAEFCDAQHTEECPHSYTRDVRMPLIKGYQQENSFEASQLKLERGPRAGWQG